MSYSNIGDGVGALFIFLMIFFPLRIWKAIEIAVWIFSHLPPDGEWKVGDVVEAEGDRMRDVVLPDWYEQWTEGDLVITEESKRWLRSRPESVKGLMLRFPPSCVIVVEHPHLCESHGGPAIVTSYVEPDDEIPGGVLGIRFNPEARTLHHVRPEMARVIAYFRGVTPEVVREIIGGAEC